MSTESKGKDLKDRTEVAEKLQRFIAHAIKMGFYDIAEDKMQDLAGELEKTAKKLKVKDS